MTTTTSIPDSRITRGIRLAAERADEFERVGSWTWIVPGCSGRESYTVDLRHSYCTCPDFQSRRNKLNRKPEPCKHVYAAEIVSAKRKRTRPSSDDAMVQDWRAVGAEDRKQKREFDPPTERVMAYTPKTGPCHHCGKKGRLFHWTGLLRAFYCKACLQKAKEGRI